MPQAPEIDLMATIDRLYVINLESRPDRRRDMLSELGRIGLGAETPLVKMSPAVRPESAEPFPSVGARGCFLSHLGVLKHARDNGYRAILLLEDDAAFTPEYISHCGTILRELNPIDWSVAYLGHRIHPGQMPGPELARTDHWRELPGDTGVETAHAMLIHQRAVEPLIRAMLTKNR